jgi:hypothetical protein
MADEKYTHPIILYGVAIHKSAASGNLADMKKVAAEAEEHLKSHGDVSAALEALKIEIAKHEAKGK